MDKQEFKDFLRFIGQDVAHHAETVLKNNPELAAEWQKLADQSYGGRELGAVLRDEMAAAYAHLLHGMEDGEGTKAEIFAALIDSDMDTAARAAADRRLAMLERDDPVGDKAPDALFSPALRLISRRATRREFEHLHYKVGVALKEFANVHDRLTEKGLSRSPGANAPAVEGQFTRQLDAAGLRAEMIDAFRTEYRGLFDKGYMPGQDQDENVLVTRDEKHKVDQEKVAEILGELEELVGLDDVKENVEELVATVRFWNARHQMGLGSNEMSLHLFFTGNPGTGKTTVARIVGRLYEALGILDKDNVVEVDRGDLVGEYVGHTAMQTKAKIKEAMGGVLFIDEAYALAEGGSEADYGREAVDTLVKAMEDHRGEFVVIFAGYPDKMEKLKHLNSGLQSRINNYIHFRDYGDKELIEIFDVMCRQNDFKATPEARAHVAQALAANREATRDNFGNGRVVRNLLEKAQQHMALRLDEAGVLDQDPQDPKIREQLHTLTLADVQSIALPKPEPAVDSDPAQGEAPYRRTRIGFGGQPKEPHEINPENVKEESERIGFAGEMARRRKEAEERRRAEERRKAKEAAGQDDEAAPAGPETGGSANDDAVAAPERPESDPGSDRDGAEADGRNTPEDRVRPAERLGDLDKIGFAGEMARRAARERAEHDKRAAHPGGPAGP